MANIEDKTKYDTFLKQERKRQYTNIRTQTGILCFCKCCTILHWHKHLQKYKTPSC